MMAEIERKWRLEALPDPEIINLGEGVLIKQGYLFTEPGELRVRRKGTRYYLTVKGEGIVSRDEWEKEIPAWVFETLWPHIEGRRVEKTRYSIEYLGLTLELDEYHSDLNGLVTLECEFPNEKTARNFVLPDWAASAKEVTEDARYKNKNLAVHGLPV